jgi:predicted MFS family arabinose efflux permease
MPNSRTNNSTPDDAQGPLVLLREGPYFRVWLTGTLAHTMRWLEMLAVGVYVFDETSSPIIVALVLFCRMIPLVLFGAAIGALAERVNKKHVLLYGLVGVAISSSILAVLLIAERAEIWHLALGGFVSGILIAMDYPVRRNIMGELCGVERVGIGMALDATTLNFTRMLGPLVGGLLLEFTGLYGAFILGATLHIVAIVLMIGLSYLSSNREIPQENLFDQIIEGIRYVRTQRSIIAVLAITLIINLLVVPYTSMLPVIGKDELGLSAFPIGILAAADGAGGLVASIIFAFWSTKRFNQVFIFGSIVYIAMILMFSFSTLYVLSVLFLFLAGFGHAGFFIGQSTLIFTQPNSALRGRVMGLLAMIIGLQPLGVLHAGFLADFFGGSTAVTIIMVEGLIGMGLCWLLWPEMSRYDVQ